MFGRVYTMHKASAVTKQCDGKPRYARCTWLPPFAAPGKVSPALIQEHASVQWPRLGSRHGLQANPHDISFLWCSVSLALCGSRKPQRGTIVGTLQCMSPEQVEVNEADAHSISPEPSSCIRREVLETWGFFVPISVAQERFRPAAYRAASIARTRLCHRNSAITAARLPMSCGLDLPGPAQTSNSWIKRSRSLPTSI